MFSILKIPIKSHFLPHRAHQYTMRYHCTQFDFNIARNICHKYIPYLWEFNTVKHQFIATNLFSWIFVKSVGNKLNETCFTISKRNKLWDFWQKMLSKLSSYIMMRIYCNIGSIEMLCGTPWYTGGYNRVHFFSRC